MKVGDRVKSLIVWPDYFAPGELGTIVRINNYSFEVEWDSCCALDTGDGTPATWWPMFEHEMELYRKG